jgi:hypothetical protein
MSSTTRCQDQADKRGRVRVSFSIDRQTVVYLLGPGVDAALQVLHLAEAGANQQLQRPGRTRPGLAEHDHLLGAIQFGEAGC